MANLVELAVEDIKPDPTQPRKFIDKERVREMAMSIKTEGIIKPIEVDDNNIIITGELRWRSAKEAGLKTIPCIKRNVSGRNRFRRQLIENLHNSTMSSIDTARAIKTLLPSGDKSEAINKLAEEIGCRRIFITEHLDVLNLDSRMQKEIEGGELPRTITRAIKLVPEEHTIAFQKKVLKEKMGRDAAVHLSRAMHFHPDMSEDLLSRDFTGREYLDIAKELDDDAPSVSKRMEQNNNKEKELHKHISAVIKWLAENNLEDVGLIHQELIKNDFRKLSRSVTKWASEQGLLNNGDSVKKLK